MYEPYVSHEFTRLHCVIMTYDYLCTAYENSTNVSEGITEGKVPSVRLLAPY
jgi:hypothetical protein